MHIYISEKLFTKTLSLNLSLAWQGYFLEWCLTRFGKELFISTFYTNKLIKHVLPLRKK